MLRLRGEIPRETKWDVVVDLFFYREPEDAEKEEQAAKEAVAATKPEPVVHEEPDRDWNATDVQDWNAEIAPAAPVAANPAYTPSTTDDWATQVQEEFSAAVPQPAATNWATNSEWWFWEIHNFDEFVHDFVQ